MVNSSVNELVRRGGEVVDEYGEVGEVLLKKIKKKSSRGKGHLGPLPASASWHFSGQFHHLTSERPTCTSPNPELLAGSDIRPISTDLLRSHPRRLKEVASQSECIHIS